MFQRKTMDAFLVKLLPILSGLMVSCTHGYLTSRTTQINEKWSKTLTAQLKEASPSYTYNLQSGSNDQITLNTIGGFTAGAYKKLNYDFVIDFAYHFEKYETISYRYSYTGPVSGSSSVNFDFFGSGFELAVGYQSTKFVKPYIGLRRDFIIASTSSITGPSYSTTNLLFGYVGLGIDLPLTETVKLTLMADYANTLVKESPIKESTATNIMAGLRWGWDEERREFEVANLK